MPARSDGDGTRTNRTSTANIERRIADHPDAIRHELAIESAPYFRLGFPRDIIAIKVIVAEPAEGKELVQSEVTELRPRSGAHVARQQAEQNVITRVQSGQ